MYPSRTKYKRALSRAATIGVVVVVIIIVAVAGYFAVSAGTSSTTTTPPTVATTSTLATTSAAGGSTSSQSQSSSSQSASSAQSSSSAQSTSQSSSQAVSTSSTSNSTSPFHQQLVIDDWEWFVSGTDANELYINGELPWPNPMANTVYQSLVNANETAQFKTGNIQYLPGLAQNWTVSPDGKTYTFNLRHNINFSNGDPFNAYQAWMEYYGLYWLTINSTVWMESYPFFNMAPVNFGPSTMALINQSGLINPSTQAQSIMQNSSWPIYVKDPFTLVFQLQAPFIFFPGALVVYDGYMFDSQYVLHHGGFGTGNPPTYNSYFNQNPIPGTGPYVVTQVAENNYISFTQNPTYWGDSLTPAQLALQPLWDPGHAKNVIVYTKTDDLSRYTDLSTGAAQLATIQTSDWNLVKSNSQYSYFVNPPWNGEVSLMGLNVNEYPTNITLVRQAIVHAINYTDLYAKGYEENMTPYVGPEYPAWSQYYDLGNFAPYQYNLTLAKQDIAAANITNMPTFTFRTVAGCEVCASAAQIIQADLAQIGITVNVEVLTGNAYYSGTYGSYATNVQNAQQIGQISFVNGGFGWGPATLTPADYWVTFVSNVSVWGNWAGYSNPTVQKCVDAFTATTNVSLIQNLCTAAQAQIQKDAPYAWLGTFGLWGVAGGSLAWKSSVVKSFYVDPVWTGQTTDPFFNTVIFAS